MRLCLIVNVKAYSNLMCNGAILTQTQTNITVVRKCENNIRSENLLRHKNTQETFQGET